jgi:hypothetical protein
LDPFSRVHGIDSDAAHEVENPGCDSGCRNLCLFGRISSLAAGARAIGFMEVGGSLF